jgi:ectoine hydroxylase-related dioxygenase (phytanoyl-CoA dioxygenase family)
MNQLKPHAVVRAHFKRDGYYFPLPALNKEEAAALRTKIEYAEHEVSTNLHQFDCFRTYSHLVIPSIAELALDSRITDWVSAILGQDLLLLHTSLFIKEPMTGHFVSWHQDLTYWGLDGIDEVTAWFAMTSATIDNGCMRFIAGSHNKWVQHEDRHHPDNMLSRSQEISVEVNEDDAVNAELNAGEISLHHGRTFHASYPNHTDDRRIGLAFRYIMPSMRQTCIENATAMLARGSDNYGHFELIDPPTYLFAPDDIARLKKIFTTENATYYQGAAYEK